MSNLPCQERCQAALVCRSWCAIICSAAAHARNESDVPLSETKTLPCDVNATDENLQLQLQQCRAVRHVPSAAVTLNEFAAGTMHQLTCLTRLVLLDPVVLRQQLDGEAWVHTPPKLAVPVPLRQLTRLQVLSIAMSSPLLDMCGLPTSLVALHLDLASGELYSKRWPQRPGDAMHPSMAQLFAHIRISRPVNSTHSVCTGLKASFQPLQRCCRLGS